VLSNDLCYKGGHDQLAECCLQVKEHTLSLVILLASLAACG
jgi:hypothetical protein